MPNSRVLSCFTLAPSDGLMVLSGGCDGLHAASTRGDALAAGWESLEPCLQLRALLSCVQMLSNVNGSSKS